MRPPGLGFGAAGKGGTCFGSPDADPGELAEAALAMVQGGILLAKTKKEARPLLHAMEGALTYLRAWSA